MEIQRSHEMRDGCASKVRLEFTKVFPHRANIRDGVKGRSGVYTHRLQDVYFVHAWKFKFQ